MEFLGLLSAEELENILPLHRIRLEYCSFTFDAVVYFLFSGTTIAGYCYISLDRSDCCNVGKAVRRRITYPTKSCLFLVLSITCLVLAGSYTYLHMHTQVVCQHNCTV